MTYTKHDRVLAIRICQIAAFGGVWIDSGNRWSRAIVDIEEALGLGDSRAGNLAADAWFEVPWTGERQDYAEAECLLRDGWLPGDPVERIEHTDRLELAREVATTLIHDGIGLDVEDMLDVRSEANVGEWVAVRVLVTDERIDALAEARRKAGGVE